VRNQALQLDQENLFSSTFLVCDIACSRAVVVVLGSGQNLVMTPVNCHWN